jgi:hypothetical protein
MKNLNTALIRLSSDATLPRYDLNTGGGNTELRSTPVSEKTVQECTNSHIASSYWGTVRGPGFAFQLFMGKR